MDIPLGRYRFICDERFGSIRTVGGKIKSYVYVYCEFGGHLNLKSKYIYANGMLLAKYDESPADAHYYHHDGLWSIMGMTNKSVNVEQSYF